jgi:hypothetical protein
VTYLLLTKDASDDALENFIASYPNRVALQWKNDNMTLYKSGGNASRCKFLFLL